MMDNETPRTRSLLRQAARNVEAGKLVAAENLYRQIVAENPESTAAWLGLAEVTKDSSQKAAAYERVLALDGNNEAAQEGLAMVREDGAESPPLPSEPIQDSQPLAPAQKSGEVQAVADKPISQPAEGDPRPAGLETPGPAASEQQDFAYHEAVQVADDDTDVELFCYRHPNRSTSLRCYKCNKPICSECTVKTPVGYLCPDCHREAENAFFNAKLTDYFLALMVALPLSLLAGWLVVRFSGGFFMILIFIFAGGAVGGFIARLAKRVMGNRRGRYIPYLVAACIVIGVLFFAWPFVLAFIAGNAGVLWRMVGMGVYLFTASSSAFYWAR
jgi:hypothetical protein